MVEISPLEEIVTVKKERKPNGSAAKASQKKNRDLFESDRKTYAGEPPSKLDGLKSNIRST